MSLGKQTLVSPKTLNVHRDDTERNIEDRLVFSYTSQTQKQKKLKKIICFVDPREIVT